MKTTRFETDPKPFQLNTPAAGDGEAMRPLSGLPIDEKTKIMSALGKGIESVFATVGLDKPVFSLLIFEGTSVEYLSNGERADVVLALRTMADRLESGLGIAERIPFTDPPADPPNAVDKSGDNPGIT